MKDEIIFLYLYVLREKKKVSNILQDRLFISDTSINNVLVSINKIRKGNYRSSGFSINSFIKKYIISGIYLKDIYTDKGALKDGIDKYIKGRFNERLGSIGLFPHQLNGIVNKINKNVDLMWEPMSKFQKFKWQAYVWFLKLIGKMPKIEEELV